MMPGCVLILENDPVMAENLGSIIRSQGLSCVFAGNRHDAMALLHVHACQMVIADLFDGISDFIKDLRSETPDVLVVVSGSADRDDDPDQLFRLEADDYLLRPCTYTHLAFNIRRLTRTVASRKLMEQQRHEHLKQIHLESIGYLARGIAHDFNNILTAILGYIEMADATLNTDSAENVRSLLNGATHAVLQSKKITATLLTFADKRLPVTELIHIDEFVTRYHLPRLQRESVLVEFDAEEDLPPVNADPDLLNQVMEHIIDNALDTIDETGRIRIRCFKVNASGNALIPENSGEFTAISIADNGKGIPEHVLPHIFDPYFSTRELGDQKGTGFGLSICYSIVQRHNGYIRAESDIGKGTRITVFFPAAGFKSPGVLFADETAVFTGTTDRRFPADRPRILVMDDEELIRDVIARSLAGMGYEPVMVDEGRAAVDAYADGLRSGRRFAAVIIDLTSTIGMGGVETLKKLKEIDPDVKGLVASGYSDAPVMSDFKQYGFSGALEKPFRYLELKTALERILTQETHR